MTHSLQERKQPETCENQQLRDINYVIELSKNEEGGSVFSSKFFKLIVNFAEVKFGSRGTGDMSNAQ